jgi:hypothetical protein
VAGQAVYGYKRNSRPYLVKKRKVIVTICGGLGNQLFQYAMGRVLAAKYNGDLILNIGDFKTDTVYKRNYLLDQYKLASHTIINSSNLNFPKYRVRGYRRFMNLFNRVYRGVKFGRITKYKEQHIYLDSVKSQEQFKAGFPVYKFIGNNELDPFTCLEVEGYWQSLDYFKEYEKELRQEFIPKLDLPEEKLEELKQIQNTESVAIGVRQYSENSTASSGHFTLGRDYYEKAISSILKTKPKAHFFIFTMPNEIEWVHEHFSDILPEFTIIKPADTNETAWQDLLLMSKCKHFILANSTFHWWGAWLSQYENSQVVAPEKGWAQERAIPDAWELLK